MQKLLWQGIVKVGVGPASPAAQLGSSIRSRHRTNQRYNISFGRCRIWFQSRGPGMERDFCWHVPIATDAGM